MHLLQCFSWLKCVCVCVFVPVCVCTSVCVSPWWPIVVHSWHSAALIGWLLDQEASSILAMVSSPLATGPWLPAGGLGEEPVQKEFPIVYLQLKSEVYIHLSQIHLNSVFHNSWHLIIVKIPVKGQLGSPLYFKNVKCQNNSRENDLFQLLFLSSHCQWVRSVHTLN